MSSYSINLADTDSIKFNAESSGSQPKRIFLKFVTTDWQIQTVEILIFFLKQ